jgi:hypothetical protein
LFRPQYRSNNLQTVFISYFSYHNGLKLSLWTLKQNRAVFYRSPLTLPQKFFHIVNASLHQKSSCYQHFTLHRTLLRQPFRSLPKCSPPKQNGALKTQNTFQAFIRFLSFTLKAVHISPASVFCQATVCHQPAFATGRVRLWSSDFEDLKCSLYLAKISPLLLLLFSLLGSKFVRVLEEM